MAKTQKTLPLHMQEPILDVVRHSVDNIDSLIQKLQQSLKKRFYVGDEVNFKADNKVIRGEITAVHERPTPCKIDLSTDATVSPSSDKENDFASSTSNLKYSVKVNDKIVRSIPPQALTRIGKLPSSDAIRKFVISQARYVSGDSDSIGHWDVKSSAKKRRLSSPTGPSKKSKIIKGKAVQRNTLDAFVKVIKIVDSPTTPKQDKIPTKQNETPTKVANSKQTPKSSKNHRSTAKSVSNNVSSCSPHLRSAVTEVVDITDRNGTLFSSSVQVQKIASGKATPVKEEVPEITTLKSTPKRKIFVSSNSSLSSSSPDASKAKGAPTATKLAPKQALTMPAISIIVKNASTEAGSTEAGAGEVITIQGLGSKQDCKKPVSLLKPSTVALKQLTLFDLARVSASNSTDGFSSMAPPTPKIVRKYRKAVKDNNEMVQRRCVVLAVKQLTGPQRSLLPSPMKALVEKKARSMANRAKMKHMSLDEKKQHIQEARKLKDDLVLVDSDMLPPGQPIALPEELPASSLSDLLFITQFLISFKSYLCQPETLKYNQLTLDALAKYISTGDDRVLEIVTSLLHTLLNDFTLSEATELGIPLKDITINRNTLFGLLSLTFTLTSEKKNRSVHEREELQRLASSIQDGKEDRLSPLLVLGTLKTLCFLLMDGQGIVMFQEDMARKANSILNDRNGFMKKYAEFATSHGLNPPEEVTTEASGTSTPTQEGQQVQPPVQSLADVLKLRRELSKKSAEEREKKEAELKRQREVEREKEQLEKQKLEATLASKLSKRLKPLGMDRNYSRYWRLPGHEGVYMERGWANQHHHSHVTPDFDSEAFLVPPQLAYEWLHYSGKAAVDALMRSLNKQGRRETHLFSKLKKFYTEITSPVCVSGKRCEEDGKEDQLSPLDSFRENLLNLEDRIRSGGLGGVSDYETWSASLETADSIEELGKHLLSCQSFVYGNRRAGVMAARKRGPVCKSNEESDEESERKQTEVEKRASLYVKQWQEAVRSTQTLSRLHVLLEVFDMCIAWEKSIDNTNCRVCKRKGDEATLLLCDGCDLGFHMSCLRPGLKKVPEGDWFCPSCTPQERQARNKRSLKELSDSDGSSEEVKEREEEVCVICNESGNVALCDTCLSGYHVSCHQPPLRAIPRFAWTCHGCRFGTKMKGNGRAATSDETASQSSSESVAKNNKTKGKTRKDKTIRLARKSDDNDQHTHSESESPVDIKKLMGTLEGRAARASRRHKETEMTASNSNTSTAVASTKCRTLRSVRPSVRKTLGAEDSFSMPEAVVKLNREDVALRKTHVANAVRSNKEINKHKQVSGSTSGVKSRQRSVPANSGDVEKENSDQKARRSSTKVEQQARNSVNCKDNIQLTLKDCVDKRCESDLTPEQLQLRVRTVHSKLWAHKSSWPFEYAIDEDEVPDYYSVVSKPMDLTTILKKSENYATADEFVEDVRQMIFNSFDYNKKESKIAQLSVVFEDYFVKMLAKYLPGVQYNKQQSLFGFRS
ncbi:tyrosine-protein kinase BAZ1B-like [Watersipora subatra]|uniref:tyrosine-protein kinase BAZ1B-like n=1 Tax=Watersipora subatra TaxID=2589382 RepID=UPI00355B910A